MRRSYVNIKWYFSKFNNKQYCMYISRFLSLSEIVWCFFHSLLHLKSNSIQILSSLPNERILSQPRRGKKRWKIWVAEKIWEKKKNLRQQKDKKYLSIIIIYFPLRLILVPVATTQILWDRRKDKSDPYLCYHSKSSYIIKIGGSFIILSTRSMYDLPRQRYIRVRKDKNMINYKLNGP